jgi:23S rRNA pseudouridine1911/1915/1917 synthase
MELDIMFEDTEILVLNKPAGRVVHPGSGTREPTLVHGLLSYTKGVLSQSEDPLRPGIVHRLDKETSGVLVVAKSDAAHRNLAQQFADHSILRRYTAFCWGKPSPLSGEIRGALGRHPVHFQKQAVVSSGGKAAHTLYETHKIYPHLGISEVHCTLKTGRTHQVRVHLSSVLHCPLVGDPLYTRKRSLGKAENPLFREIVAFPRQALHAMVLGFTHPTTGQPLRFACPLPPDLARLKEVLESS